MTDTPRTCVHGIAADCEQCWWIRTHEHRWSLMAPNDAVCTADGCVTTRGRAIEAEAAAPTPAELLTDNQRAAYAQQALLAAAPTPAAPLGVERLILNAYRAGWSDAKGEPWDHRPEQIEDYASAYAKRIVAAARPEAER